MSKKQYKVGYFEDPNPVDSYVECDGEYLNASDVVGILKELQEENEQLKKQLNELNKYCIACDDTLITIQELTYKLLSVDFAGAESKADYCRLLNELDNKDLSFIHDCIEAINECDLMKMEELKREYGGSE